ncbi:MAG TPA: insulinase family protein [bacterium]|nr:insulinase family protein [bacterium]
MKREIPVVEYRKDLPYTRILLHFPGGSSLEDDKTLGFAHLCEHLAFKLRVGEDGIAEFVEGLGGGSNAFTSNDLVVFEITVLNEFVGKTIKFLEKIFALDLETISDADFEEEKRVVLEEMAMYEDEPMENLYTDMMKNLFPSHSYGKRVIGEKETVGNATKRDISEFWKERISNVPFLVIGGGYNKIPSISICCNEKPLKVELSAWNHEEKFELKNTQKKNYFIAGWKLPLQDGKIDAVLRMIYAVTYGMDGGRLYNGLVYEKGILDNINISTFGGLHGSVFIQSGALPSEKAKWRLQKWIECWDTYRFTQSEVARAREVMLSNEYFGLEGLGGMPEIMGKSYMLYGNTEKLEKDFFYEFMHLTAEDLNRFKEEHLSFDKMIFGISKSPKCKVSVNELIFPSKRVDKIENSPLTLKRAGVKGVIKPLTGSSFITGYIIKKSGTLLNLEGYPGSFKLFLDSMCTSANGMTREETESCLDRFGITLSPVYGNNVGGIKFKVRDNFALEAIDIIHKIFQNPIKEEDFNSEKLYTLSNISLLEEEPSFHITNAIHETLFKGTPYEHSVSGTAEGTRNIKFEHIGIIKDKYFSGNNFSVALSGAAGMDILEKMIAGFVRKDVEKTGNFKLKNVKLNDKVIKIPMKGRKMTHIARVFKAPSVYGSDFEKMKLLENYMTGQKSPMFQLLREKQGLVYSFDVSGMSGVTGGYVIFSAITTPGNTNLVMNSMGKAIDHLRKGDIDRKYLLETKNILKTSFANSVVKSNFHAYNLALEEALGLPFESYMKYTEVINSIKENDITETALKWLDDGFWVIAGEV